MKAENPGYPVPLDRIESELAGLWRRGESEAGLRASTMNLIILSWRQEHFERMRLLVPEIAEHHPGRIMLAFSDPESDSETIEATLSAYCQLAEENSRQICCEQINLHTGGPGLRHLPGAIIPLLLPALPVFLWIPDTSHLDVLAHFAPAIDRVILETPARFKSVRLFLETAGKIIAAGLELKISDMRWAELTPWREAVAQFFDGSQGAARMNALRRIRIGLSGRSLWTGAVLLAGWLVSLLAAGAPQRGGAFRFRMPSGGEVILALERDTTPEPFSIHLHTRGDDGEDLICRVRPGEAATIEADMVDRGGARTVKTFSAVADSEIGRLCRELDYLQADRIYLRSLDFSRGLLKGASKWTG